MIRFKVREKTRLLILHDSHTKPSVETSVNVIRWQGRKNGLLEIGYHFVIWRDGFIEETRPMALIGTHTRGHNLDSIGICLIGGRSNDGAPEDNFTQLQRESLFDLIRLLKQQYRGVALVGHDEVQRRNRLSHPACPVLDMQDLRRDYHTYVTTGGMVV